MAGFAESERFRNELKFEGRIPTWSTTTRYVDSLIRQLETERASHRVLNFDCFTSSWASAQWRDLYSVDRKACQWAEQTVLIPFTGSFYFDDAGEQFIPPITYFARLQESASARQKMLSRLLSDIPRWQSIRVVGEPIDRESPPYPVLFLGLYLSSRVEKEDLDPVLTTHVTNCPIADSQSHLTDEAVTVKYNPTHKSQLIHALGKRVPGLKSAEGVTAEPWNRRAVATVLHAGNWRPCRFGRSI